MAASRFFEVLPVLMDGERQVGVCAMGPIGDGDNLLWMRAWVWQQDEASVAASAGKAGKHVRGAHALSKEDEPPFAAPKKRWMVQTAFEPASAEFSLEKPVLVQALALVETESDGKVERDIVQWSQAVALREPRHEYGDGHAHG
jgi:hypothetical protein